MKSVKKLIMNIILTVFITLNINQTYTYAKESYQNTNLQKYIGDKIMLSKLEYNKLSLRNKGKKDEKSFIEYIIRKMNVSLKNIHSYQLSFSSYSRGKFNKGIKGREREELIKGKISYQEPANFRIKVTESPEKIARGATIIYTGGEKLKVKASGILGIIPVSFDIENPLFANARGHQIFHFLNNLERINSKGNEIEFLGVSEINGRKSYILKVKPIIKADPEITHELYAIDSESFVILLNEMYVGEKMVSQYEVKEIKNNVEIPEDYFNF